MDVLKVSADVKPNNLAWAIRDRLERDTFTELHAILAGATNQAVKAIAILDEYYRNTDHVISCVPVFDSISITGREVTMIKITVYLDRLLSLARYNNKSYNRRVWKRNFKQKN